MSKIRVNKTGNFTIMSNFHFKEKKMSLKAKGLLSLMLSLPDDWNYTVSGLVTLSKDGKDGVMSALSELEEFGYLKRERLIDKKGRYAGIEYNIYEEPQGEKPIADKPTSAKPISANPTAEKAPQLNTNQLKNLFNELYNLLNTKDESLLELYKEYIEMRENIKAPLTTNGLEKLISRNERLSKGNVRVQKLLLETAIINNWKNVYLPREQEVEAVNKDFAEDLRSSFGLE